MNKIILIVITIIVTSTYAFSKCSLIEYRITGTIKSEQSNTGIKNAQVFIFFDENQSTNSSGHATEYPDFVRTDSNGNFTSTNYFDSYAKWSFLRGDICSNKPSKIEVVIINQGFKTKRRFFYTSKLKVEKENDIHKINLPVIFLEK